MSEQWIEVEADSLEEARELLKSQVPEGLHLISERVISEGSVQTIKAYADSVEAAFAKARSEVPEGAKIVKETKHADPKREGFTVEAADEESARSIATWRASNRYGKEATVENLRLVAEGKKGLLGIGRKPNQYEVTVFQPALVEISYQGKVRIAGQAGLVGVLRLKCRGAYSSSYPDWLTVDLRQLSKEQLRVIEVPNIPYIHGVTRVLHGPGISKILVSEAEEQEGYPAISLKIFDDNNQLIRDTVLRMKYFFGLPHVYVHYNST